MPVHDWTRVDAGLFHHFHTAWLVALAAQLNRRLPSEYYALAEQRAIGLIPDVLTLETAAGMGPLGSRPNGGGGAVLSLSESPPRVQFDLRRPARRRTRTQRLITVRHVRGDQIVAVIEIVSPSNKATRNEFRSFLDKVIEYIDAGVNVLLIDLLPPTPRDPNGLHLALWSELAEAEIELEPGAKPLTLASYVAGSDVRAFVQTVAVGDPLPDMPLCLDPDTYVPTPLEPTYQSAFEEYPWRWRSVLIGPIDGGGAANGT